MSNVTAYDMYIDGQFTTGSSKNRTEVENPADESIVATVPEGTKDDAIAALEAAKRAQPGWAALPANDRGVMIKKLAEAVLAQSDHLAEVVVKEQGKPLDQAQGEITATAMFLQYAGEQARRMQGEILPSDHTNEDVWIRRSPYGVVAGLTAWNYPSALVGRKMGPALTAGNTIVLKGHDITPLSGLEIARISHELGFPKGVINVITGDGRSVGETLVTSPLTDMLSMTGSVRAGKEIYAAAAEDLKVLRLELGGKAPFIVMEDADIDAAVDAAIVSRFTNCGQICTCAERIYVHRDVAQEFTEKFVARAKAMTLGDPMSSPNMGPKVSRVEVDKVDQIVTAAKQAGAEVLTGGQRAAQFDKGYWYEPTVMTAAKGSLLTQTEIFGPVAPITVIDSFEEAMTEANNTEYGLSAYLFTNDMTRIMHAANHLEFGEVYVNRCCGELVQGFHNGWKHSGLGGEDGQHGFEGYLRKKSMYVNWS